MQTSFIIFAIVQIAVHFTFVLLIVHVVGEYRRMFRETLDWAMQQRVSLVAEIGALKKENAELHACVEKYKR